MYSGVRKIFGRYWTAYGGFKALVRSPYLHATAVLLVLTGPYWWAPGWWDQSLGVLPNLLGFTLGGFALFIGIGDDQFRRLLAKPEEEETSGPYLTLCATFVHFVVVQITAVTLALLAKAWWFEFDWPPPVASALPLLNKIFWATGYCAFLYSLTSAVALTMQVFRVAWLYQEFQRNRQTEEENDPPSRG